MQQSTSDFQENFVKKIAKWKAGLADLGRRNPLIKFKEDSPRTLEIVTDEPEILFHNLIEGKKKLKFQMLDSDNQDIIQSRETRALPADKNPLELITKQTGNERLKRLKKLRSEAKRSFEERGVNSLFIAIGTLTWYDKDKPEDALRSPLVLVPVELIKEPRQDIYKISVLDEEIVLNPTLAQKLKQTFGIELPEQEAIQGLNYNEIIDEIRELLAEQKTWEIKENVFLSLFSYAKAAMVRDITENEALIFAHPILQAIIGDLTTYQSNYREPLAASTLDPKIKPERIFQILDADSSQQVVIEAAKSGSSFVVQGPPGTGKSQTIVNMIAELIADGKSVLLVAEKETALSVVYKRMVECGLEHICLNLHHSGTTNKRVLIENLSKTIEYLEQIYSVENDYIFFETLVSTRQSLNSYLTSLHVKEKPLDKSPFEIFGELLQKEREAVPSINITFSNFNQWNPTRLQEAKDLLNQLAQFLSFFKREKTTIWAKSSLNSYSYDLELQIREKIEEFQQELSSIKNINQQLQVTLKIQSLSNLESLDKCDPALSHIIKAPLNLPDNWVRVDVITAHNVLAILKTDVQEIEKNKLSQETQNLLDQLSSFLPFLRGEKTTIWARSNLNTCSEILELEIKEKIRKLLQGIYSTQAISQQIEVILRIEPLLNMRSIENSYSAIQHILKVPLSLPDNWIGVNIALAKNAFSILKKDVQEIENHKRHQGNQNIFLNLFNFFGNNKYNSIQLLQKKLHQIDYPARQVFGDLFNPEISREADLQEIEKALNWLIELQKYSLPIDSVQNILNSSSIRRSLAEIVEQLEYLIGDIQKGIDFLFSYFNENDIIGQYKPRNQILFGELLTFLNLAESDLPEFREWLTYKEIYKQLENLGVQNFLDALRENKPNPILIIRNKLRDINYPSRKTFGNLFDPEVSSKAELKEIETALNWLADLQQYSINPDSVQQIINSPAKRRELDELVNKYKSTHNNIRQGLDFLLSHFEESNITDSYLPRNQITFIELESFLNLAQSELPYFQEWLTYKETYQKLENLGTTKFLDALRDNQIEPKLWFTVLEKRIYQICLDAILAVKPELKNFNIEVHERQIKEFSKLDYNQLDAARKRLKQLHVERWQNWEKTSLALTELPNLQREVNRRRQHLPIRKLLNDTQRGTPNLVKALKPCWMMSPLSVSQYIDANVVHFDVLIFDEASQLRTEDVVPSIIRSNQVIVIGDKKQLPPTSFFSTGDSEEDINDEDDASYESVLDECSNFMFGRTLKWHYRSQDERLITFSNKYFYDSELVTFPNPVQNPDLGVYFKHVPDGIYDRGGRRDNQREAEVVAQLALEHFQRVSEQSLGIIAFSEAQSDAIQEQLEILAKKQKNSNFDKFCSDNSPQFFLKALENVQGDERDAIILSIGYARDSQGKFTLNFGPLTKQGGERRLNVAVTRAKCKITLVSSIIAGDIDLARSKSEGVRLLRDYLVYAASGGERLEGNLYTDKLKFDSPFEEDVYHTLVELGYVIRSQVGCSGYRIDLAVVDKNHPGEFLLGIECDGASYHNTPTARDRDRLRQQVLEKLGWNIHRIWSTDWFRNKPAQVRLLRERIQELQNNR
ncbi:DUF4011 domain-containing protein [Brunnivagina elsteri]|uniref:RAP domain-containing protein n=1 Tax=Brunnivagina elsteri CCALA 953 TaxID=987040 RepID=A0A2A2TJB6_9CYAN|nr:DUF4011 domain-containing protein [Calothrix elsteri]PAX55178.1 hypothetical protein CK510_11505 [Calothrix elsteri CCALA 953]